MLGDPAWCSSGGLSSPFFLAQGLAGVVGVLLRGPCFPAEDQLFRSVEGQAASDEEEEKWAADRAPQLDHVKRILAKLPCCGSG